VLSSNNLAELADLDALGSFPRLTHLVLSDNPVSKKEVSAEIWLRVVALTNELQNYRYWVLWKCPSVRFLDFVKVKESEREKARELFGTEEEPTPLASKVRTALLRLLHRC
jgi:U2 small nuclear ribonucleoprotein A'